MHVVPQKQSIDFFLNLEVGYVHGRMQGINFFQLNFKIN